MSISVSSTMECSMTLRRGPLFAEADERRPSPRICEVDDPRRSKVVQAAEGHVPVGRFAPHRAGPAGRGVSSARFEVRTTTVNASLVVARRKRPAWRGQWALLPDSGAAGDPY